jgi:hypothetical protein
MLRRGEAQNANRLIAALQRLPRLLDQKKDLTMMIQVDDMLTLEVSFHPANREEGYEDDIRFALKESGPKESRLFPAEELSFLLTPDQAERLAAALVGAAAESRKTPR